MDGSPSDFSIHGVFQVRILEWVAISFSRGSSPPRNRTQVSRTAGRHFTLWAKRDSQSLCIYIHTHMYTYVQDKGMVSSKCCCLCKRWWWWCCLVSQLSPMDCNTPGLPVPHHLPKIAQDHVHCISGAIQASHPPMPFFSTSGTFPVTQLFTSDDQNTRATALESVLPANIQGWSPWRLAGLISFCPRDFQKSSPALQLEDINSLVFCLLYGPALPTTCDHWEDHSLDSVDLCQQSDVSAFQHTV